MAVLATFGLILGGLLGLRFRVLALLPAQMAGAAVCIGHCVAGSMSSASAMTAFVIFSLCLQGSYALSLARPLLLRRAPSRAVRT